MAEKPKAIEQEQYQGQYTDQINAGLNSVVNREAFTYDPLKDASYQSMAKLYAKQGKQASQNALGDAASLNGGYGSSFAVTASQQAQNDYNQMLASQMPALQEAAYNRYLNEHNLNLTALDALRAADASEYARYRDTVGDKQWQYGMDYQSYRDDIGDSQWQKSFDRSVFESDRDYSYQQARDQIADQQWAQQYAASRSSGGGGSSSGGYIGSSSNTSKGQTVGSGDLSGLSALIAKGTGKAKQAASKTVNKVKK